MTIQAAIPLNDHQYQRSQNQCQSQLPNAITLSFNGVDFRLIPSSATAHTNDANTSASISMVPNTNGKFTVLNLNSFTGSLVVSASPPVSLLGIDGVGVGVGVTPTINDSPTNHVSATTVEDEPATPDNKDADMSMKMGAHVTEPLQKGQQQLSFVQKKQKRGNNNNDTVHKSKKQCKTTSIQKSIPTLGQASQMSQGPIAVQTNSTGQETLERQHAHAPKQPLEKKSPSKIEQLVQREEMIDTQMEQEEPTQIFGDDHHDDDDDDNDTNAILEYESEEESVLASKYSTKALSATATVATPVPAIDPNRPCERWGHTMNLIDGNKILIYGGQAFDEKENKNKTLKDLHVYDMQKRAWSKPVNCEGMPRCWHSASYLPDRQLLISFGGEAHNEKTKKTVITDQVMVLDTEIMLWYPPSVSGQVPSGRSGHTTSMLQNQLLVFGGVKNNKWQKSLAVLDTMRWMWSAPKIAGDTPRARSYHSATPVADSNLLVIFGGNNETECFNSVHVLDTKNEKWSWFHPTVSGTPPCPRTGHVAVLLEDGKTILVYGGWDPNVDDEDGGAAMSDEDYIFGDSFLLNTETWTWKPGPKPKFAPHQMGTVNGGLKRVGASSILAPGDDMSQMLVFGGRVPNDRFSNDFQSTTVPQRMLGM